MRVGLFGGSFDPPHAGHLAVAIAACEAKALDRILLAPVGLQPLKPNGSTASYPDRLRMVELLCGADVRLQASQMDAPREDGQPNYTLASVRSLRSTLQANDEVFVVVGIDAFLDVKQWRGWKELLELAQWVVVSRPGFSPEALLGVGLSDAESSRVNWLGGVSEAVSATAIRSCLSSGADCSSLLTPEVFRYIQERALYGCGALEAG